MKQGIKAYMYVCAYIYVCKKRGRKSDVDELMGKYHGQNIVVSS